MCDRNSGLIKFSEKIPSPLFQDPAVRIRYHLPPTAAYKCSVCDAMGCKLWRMHNSKETDLRCCRCASNVTSEPIDTINHEGVLMSEIGGGLSVPTDCIGRYTPAVPDEEGEGFWGQTNVPKEGVDWWTTLPTFPPNS